MPASNYLATAKLGHVLGITTYTAATDFYFALCKIVPLASDTGSTITEVAYTSYVRLHKTKADFTALVANASSNTAQWTWAAPGATGDTAYGWAMCDASSAGNVLYFDAFATPQVITVNGPAPFIAANQFVLLEM